MGVSNKQLKRSSSVSPDTNNKLQLTISPPLKNHLRSSSYKELRGKSPKVDNSLFKLSPPSNPIKNRPSPTPSNPNPTNIKIEIEQTTEIKNTQTTTTEPEVKVVEIKKNTNINNPSIQALKSYYELQLPKKGQNITFTISQYLNPIHFQRPFFDEQEELFAEWGLPLTFHLLSFRVIIVMLSAILLERKVVVCCKRLRFLSALVLSLPPLLRPFLYQSVIIPMLPQTLPHLLEAPVPYVIGVTHIPEDTIISDDVVIINVEKDSYKSTLPVPTLPRSRALYPLHFFSLTFHPLHFFLNFVFFTRKNCESYLKKLSATIKKGNPPYTTSKEQMILVDNISTTFENHLGSLFANFHNYTICNKTDPDRPITVFMKDSFLADIEDDSTLEFIEHFLETQTFFQYSDKCLRKRDDLQVRINL